MEPSSGRRSWIEDRGSWVVDEEEEEEEEEGEEGMLTARPEVISSGWMRIGRQVRTSFGGIIDLFALAPDGSLVPEFHHDPYREACSGFRVTR